MYLFTGEMEGLTGNGNRVTCPITNFIKSWLTQSGTRYKHTFKQSDRMTTGRGRAGKNGTKIKMKGVPMFLNLLNPEDAIFFFCQKDRVGEAKGWKIFFSGQEPDNKYFVDHITVFFVLISTVLKCKNWFLP